MMDLRKSKASNWEKLRLEVTSGHWRNAFLGQVRDMEVSSSLKRMPFFFFSTLLIIILGFGQFSSGNRQNLHRKLQLKNLSAANSSLVKVTTWWGC